MMHVRSVVMTTIMAVALSGCSDASGTSGPTPPDPPASTILLKDIVIPNLPSPYYHFEYDLANRIKTASFASGFTMYDVTYDGGRISEMDNHTAGNQDRLVYIYDDSGRVASIRYVDSNEQVFRALFLSYDGWQLTGLERDRSLGTGFVIEKTMSFAYYPDGNVREIVEYYPPIEGLQDEATTVDRFERYDDRVNVDGFGLLHQEFFDHLVLLPGVQLQKGNPGVVTHTGDGINYEVEYQYTYDERQRPLTRSGQLTFLNGPDLGRQFPTLSLYSYY